VRNPALSLNTSAAATEDAINVLMAGLASGTAGGAAGNVEEGIVGRIAGRNDPGWF
jgi:hypothetical protein